MGLTRQQLKWPTKANLTSQPRTHENMDSEPSEFVCVHCNLRFKNPGTYDKHKRKFCQGRRENSWSPTKSARVVHEVQQRDPFRNKTADDDFWAGKTSTSQSLHSSSNRHWVCSVNLGLGPWEIAKCIFNKNQKNDQLKYNRPVWKVKICERFEAKQYSINLF